jgi:hypothetical protein
VALSFLPLLVMMKTYEHNHRSIHLRVLCV